MEAGDWLRLTDYASKYRVSISTLRRRIKSGQLPFKFEEGKYLVQDQVPSFSDHSNEPVSSVLSAEIRRAMTATENAPLISEAQEKLNRLRENTGTENPSAIGEDPIFSSASRLLGELKRAYMNILHEKEEQIIQLKEEVTDLKTLVRVLEDDNERLRRIISPGDRGPTSL